VAKCALGIEGVTCDKARLQHLPRRVSTQVRGPSFRVFFAAWTLVHSLVFILVLDYLGFPWYIPIAVVELWIGYAVAIWRFGLPPDRGIR
jgi:hypothetical protein